MTATLLSCKLCGALLPAQATSCPDCGASATPICSAVSWPPHSLLTGRYQILQRIGQGGFATVYKAKDRLQRNKLVAIKQIHLEGLSLQELIDATDVYNREVVHLSALQHRNLPHIYDHFTDAQHWYIVMEYLKGQTLEDVLASSRQGFLPLKRVVEIGLMLCDVFQHLHTQRPPIIFRDVKPQNIILTHGGRLCLIDFGIARLYRPGRKDTGPLGTMGYAAPEQYGRRAQTTPQTDIYGLGATLQTLLTGKDPLEVRREGIPPERARTIPQPMQDLLAYMIAPDAAHRPRNMDEVRQRLQSVKDDFFSEKVKRTGAFLWELWKEVPIFTRMSLFALLVIDLFSAFVWWPLWMLSLLFLVLSATGRTIFTLQQARAESLTKLSMQERCQLIWEQVMGAFPPALLLTFFCYYLYYLSINWSGLDADVVIAALIVIAAIIGGLFWAIRSLLRLRTLYRQSSQQVQPPPLQQNTRNPR